MKKLLAIALVATLMLGVAAVAQQNQSSKPPKYIWTEQVVVAEGKAATYPGLMAQVRRAADSTKADTSWIAASSITGDMRRTFYVSFHDNFASVEKDLTALQRIGAKAMEINPNFAVESGQHVLTQRSTFAVFREDLSYQPEKVPFSQAKYWMLTTIYLKAGHMSDYAEQIREEIELLKRGGLDHHVLVYQVILGLPSSGSAFYVMNPLKSLADMDVDDSDKAKAVFTPAVRHRFEMTNQQMINNIESDLLMVRPELSRPPRSFVDANPEFWTVKDEPTLPAKNRAKQH